MQQTAAMQSGRCPSQSAAIAKSITPISNSLTPIVTVRLLKRSAR